MESPSEFSDHEREQALKMAANMPQSVQAEVMNHPTGPVARLLVENAGNPMAFYEDAAMMTGVPENIRHVSRPPVATERLAMTSSGQVRYHLKTAYRDGTTHIVMEPLDLVARLAALVPPPRMHLTRYHGVFAPHSRLRAAVTPAHRGVGAKQPSPSGKPDEKPTPPKHVAMNWARRLKRVFGVEIEGCARCGGRLRIIASIEEPGHRLRSRCCHEPAGDGACRRYLMWAERHGLCPVVRGRRFQADGVRQGRVVKGSGRNSMPRVEGLPAGTGLRLDMRPFPRNDSGGAGG